MVKLKDTMLMIGLKFLCNTIKMNEVLNIYSNHKQFLNISQRRKEMDGGRE